MKNTKILKKAMALVSFLVGTLSVQVQALTCFTKLTTASGEIKENTLSGDGVVDLTTGPYRILAVNVPAFSGLQASPDLTVTHSMGASITVFGGDMTAHDSIGTRVNISGVAAQSLYVRCVK